MNKNNKSHKNLKKFLHFLKSNRTLRWLLVLFFAWLMPSIIFWTGITVFTGEENERSFEIIKETANNDLSSLAYDSIPTRHLHPKLNKFYNQLKGFKIDSMAFEKIISDFQKSWPENSIDIYVFDGNRKICNILGAKKEHEVFFNIISEEFLTTDSKETEKKVRPEILSKVFSAPELIIDATTNKPDAIIDLGNPKRNSYVYWNFDKTIKSRFVAGMLFFIHKENFPTTNIVKEILMDKDQNNFGFISKTETNLPKIINNIPLEIIKFHFNNSPTNSFILNKKVISIQRIEGDILIVSAFKRPRLPIITLGLILITYLLATVVFLKITYGIIKRNEIYHHFVKHRLTALFALCYCLPLAAAMFLSIQYLYRLNHRMTQEKKINNYKALSEIDKGFERFLTSKLMQFRGLTSKLKDNIHNPDSIKNSLDAIYQNFECESIHVISSQSKVLYSTDFIKAEVRKYAHLPTREKEKMFASWKARNATIPPFHREVFFDNIKLSNIADASNLRSNVKNFRKLLTSAALSAMDYHNNSHGFTKSIPRDSGALLIDAILETANFSLFQTAQANIARFTTMQTLSDIMLGYLDVIDDPLTREAWYCYAIVVDLATLEFEYLTEVFKNLNNDSNLAGLVAISNAPFATNFPTRDEFKNFEEIIKRSEGDTKTFTHQMKFKGKNINVEALRCSFLKHYLLLKVTDQNQVQSLFKRNLLITGLLFSGFILAGIILANMLVKLLITPIDSLIKGVSEYSLKNYGYQIPIQANNDFGVLANACNYAATLAKDLEINKKIEELLYPEKEINIGSYTIDVVNESSHSIPSDFFDFISLKQGVLAFIIAKIPGNSMATAFYITKIKTAFKILTAKYPNNPEKILEAINKIIITKVDERKILISCLIGVIDPTNDSIILANAAYPYPITIATSNKNFEFISLSSTPLGQSLDSVYEKKLCTTRDRAIVLYSEGVTTLKGKNNKPIGHEAFLQIINKTVEGQSKVCPNDIVKTLKSETVHMAWQQDITLITIQPRI